MLWELGVFYSQTIWAATWYFQQCGMCDQQRLRTACAYSQSDQSLCWSLEFTMTVKLLTEPHFVFLSLKEGCTCLSESIHVKMPHCWKSHAAACNSVAQRIGVSSLRATYSVVPLYCYVQGAWKWTVISESCYIKDKFYKSIIFHGHFPIIHL